ncbi:hypothetical protein RE9416_21460 [Prescottella equi]|nr:hypothetical protein RE9416_21460 [Prescottella equi]BCN58818.1 hypothetical protein RE9427_21880 [Prescottella equi]
MSAGEYCNLALGDEVSVSTAGQIVDRTMHDRHVRAAVTQQTRLFADLAQQNIDRVGMLFE